ncbi:hypothetical protein NEF87_002516 [Candidatus Lokiarchaeum ossiferum]|uniref:Longin domain-containing protein n=1 Tax=Candidatus Lokiarchaeum ossiferum TaxID=2951803 RepID=A0ABY6HUI1_9ARCH|nr:hypothetical protein NEF87_002516 [Candidatus Lokiarchaeum sp. B-35]
MILVLFIMGIYKILVFQRHSGLNLLDVAVEELPDMTEISGILISGLLTSFMHFTNEVLQEDIRLVETQNFRMVFSFNEELGFVVVMDRKGPVAIAEKVLGRMKTRFSKQFQAEITESFSGNVSSFDAIAQQMEEITKLKGLKLAHHVASSQYKRKMMDFKDAFKKYLGKKEEE